MLKIYESLVNFYFATNIKVKKDDIRRIEFSGGIRQPREVYGTFTTNDKELQEAIEKDKGYGKKFKLKAEYKNPNQDDDDEESLEEKEFSTVTEAKEWLNKEKGVGLNKLPNKTAVLKEAESLGVKILFPTE